MFVYIRSYVNGLSPPPSIQYLLALELRIISNNKTVQNVVFMIGRLELIKSHLRPFFP